MEDIEQVSQLLVGLITRMNTTGLDEESNKQLFELSSNPSIVYPCFAIIESQQPPIVIKTAYIMLCNALSFYVEESEQRTEIFSRLIANIPTAPNTDCRTIVIDKVCDLFTGVLSSAEILPFLQQIAEISTQLIQNEETLESGFRIWSKIIFKDEIMEEYSAFITENLIPLALGAFSSEKVEIRIETYKVLAAIVQRLTDEEALDKEVQGSIIEGFGGALTLVAETTQDNIEATALSHSMSHIIEFCEEVAYEMASLIEPILTYIQNTELDQEIRIQYLNILISLISYYGIDFAEQLQEYIPIIVNFSVELATVNPEEGLYRATDDFFRATAEAIEGAELEEGGEPINTLSIYFPILSELIEAGTPQSFLTSFLIFTSMLFNAPYVIVELYDQIEEMIVASIGSDNGQLVEAALLFIGSIVNEEQTMALHIQTKFEGTLQQLVATNDISDVTNLALKVLIETYNQSETPSADPLETIQFFLSQFETTQTYRHELALQGISKTILYMEEVPDTIYPAVSPYIKELITSGQGAVCSAIEGIAAFAIKQPAAIVEDLEGYIEVLSAALSSKDFGLISSAAETSTTLFDCFQTTLEGQIPAFFELALKNASKIGQLEDLDFAGEEEDEMMEEEDEGEYEQTMEKKREAYGNCLILSCLLFSLAPEPLKESAESLQEIFSMFIGGSASTTIIIATKGAPDLITGLAAIDINPSDIFNQLIELYPTDQLYSSISELWDSISFCFRLLPIEVATENAQKAFTILCSILDCECSVYTKGGKKGHILRDEVVKSLLTMIEEMLIKLEGEFEQYIPEIAPRIIKLLESKSPIVRSCALITLSMIISFFPGQTDLIPLAMKEIEQDIPLTFQVVRKSIFLAFHFLTLANKELVQSTAEDLLTQCIESIKEEDASTTFIQNAALLWGTLVMAFDVTPSAEDLELVLKSMPGPIDNYILKGNAIFLDYCLKKWEEATLPYALKTSVTVLGSDDYLVSVIPSEVLATLATVITSAPEGAPEAQISNNERSVANFRRHIEQLSQ